MLLLLLLLSLLLSTLHFSVHDHLSQLHIFILIPTTVARLAVLLSRWSLGYRIRRGSIPTLVGVFLCFFVGPFLQLGLSLG